MKETQQSENKKDQPVTISQLEKEGWKGLDTSLEISLFEYGVAWRRFKDSEVGEGQIRFYYGVEMREDPETREEYFFKFDWSDFSADVDVFEELDWVDWDSILKQLDSVNKEGVTKEEFKELFSVEHQIIEAYHYHGNEVFGDPGYCAYPFEIVDE